MKKIFTDHFGKFWQTPALVLRNFFVHLNPKRGINDLKLVAVKLMLLLFILNIFDVKPAFAQQNNIVLKGVVVDSKDGEGLAGISITDAGRRSLGVTGMDGSFTLNIPKGTSVSFSMIGYTTFSKIYNAGESNINIQLEQSTSALNEVVVTALGIKREQKALGFATQTLKENALNDARSNNWVGALSGKVAGLNIVTPGSGPVNSSKIILRGETSMNSDNNGALIVLDGVPVGGGLTSSGVGNAYGAGSGNDVPVDFGNGISDINPDDIESVTVLKGASAAALYGSRAANGALIITTKSGVKKNKGIGVSLNSNYSYNDILRWPDMQYEYGQGTGTTIRPNSQLYYSYGASADGASTSGTSSAYGPRFNGQSYFQYDPVTGGQSATRLPWVPYTNNRSDFFRTGSTLTNSVSFDGGSENASARASITHSKNEWIMPNTGYERLTAALSLNFKLSPKLRINSKVNFTNKTSDNLPATGYNNQSLSYFMIFQNPNVDLDWYRPIWKPGLEQIDQIHPFSSFIDNPFLIAYEMTNAVNNYKTVANMSATYDFTKKLSLMVRSGFDMLNEDRDQRRPFSTANFQKGYLRQQNIFNFEINTDVLLTYKTRLNKDFEASFSGGANALNRRYTGVNGTVEGLIIPAVYKLSNGQSNPLMNTNYLNKKVQSIYGFASFSWKDRIFLDVTGRNDWSSTLPIQNNSFFYPSVSSSFILNELFQLPTAVTYAKLRLSAAQVGNDTDPYKTSKYYGISDFPASASVPTTLHNATFKPEITTSYEAGLEYNLFKSRFTMDLTFYSNTTKNQILDVPLDPTTGYSRAVLNAGVVRNKGIELLVGGKPVKTKNFSWTSTVNWSKNDNEVLELAEGLTDKQDIGYGGNATIQARVGGTTGDIYGFGFVRAPDGQIVYNTTGLPARPGQIQYIGKAYADWRGGLSNEFQYKNYRFSFLFDGQYGGMIYSQTHHKMAEQGKLSSTLKGREEGFIVGEGVVAGAGGLYTANTKQVAPAAFYGDYYRRANVESNSFDASFIKLREVRLEYGIPAKFIKKLKLNQASLALYGRDLAIISDFPMFDPETAALNGSTILPGVEMGQMPSTRTFGMNLTVKF
ncbi:TonB-linked outer membrane protein, SusC/RagA family [Daejeonella rubra]|uniref:TonB-linked outer membrane protein, SusC/RagA family n=1 Tax=Daejeonella rubra TaxID=990371 RepID=A0A1G9LQN9_9SPHI|nr:SusC/RagA family TonB-linked outer membrane protein [Daejeonella rubra]SDL64248.1 TonB-linked outer membrane protein, SusC/RagA family [Daejeonella rubra]